MSQERTETRADETTNTAAGTSRRSFLQGGSATGVVLATGRVGNASLSTSSTVQETDEGWGGYQNDAANTGYAPENTGPVTDVGEKWRESSSENPFRQPGQAVADGMVYTIKSNGCVAYDAETGTQEWHYESNGLFIQATPTVWNRTVYIPDHGGIHALDAEDGTEQWFYSTVAEIEGETSEEVDGISNVVDGTIYVGGHENSLRLHAVDAETGEKQWHFEVETLINTTPAVGDGTVYVSSSPNLIAIDAESGEEKWRYNTKGAAGSATVAGDTVYVGGNGQHHALDIETGKQVWTAETGAGGALAGQAVADGTVYASSDEGLFALDAETGEKQWDDRWKMPRGAGPPAVVSGTVYFMTGTSEESNPQLLAVDADSGEQVWSITPENTEIDRIEPIAVANTTVYAVLGESLYAIEGTGPTPEQTPTDADVKGESSGGLPLIPLGGGLLALLVFLLALLRRRDEEDNEQDRQ